MCSASSALPEMRPKLIGPFGQPNAGDYRRRDDDGQDRGERDETGTRHGPFIDHEAARPVENDWQQRPVRESPVGSEPVGYRKIDQRRQDERHQQQQPCLPPDFIGRPNYVGQRGFIWTKRGEKNQRKRNVSHRAENIEQRVQDRFAEWRVVDDAFGERKAGAVAGTHQTCGAITIAAPAAIA